MTNESTIDIHDRTGQLYRVTIRNHDTIIRAKKLKGRLRYLANRRPLNFGIKAFKRSGATRKQVAEYKQRIHAEAVKVHEPYIQESARFETFKQAKGLQIR